MFEYQKDTIQPMQGLDFSPLQTQRKGIDFQGMRQQKSPLGEMASSAVGDSATSQLGAGGNESLLDAAQGKGTALGDDISIAPGGTSKIFDNFMNGSF